MPVQILSRTIRIEAPLPFSDAEAEALIDYVELTIDLALQAVVDGILDAARGPVGHEPLRLAASAIATVDGAPVRAEAARLGRGGR